MPRPAVTDELPRLPGRVWCSLPNPYATSVENDSGQLVPGIPLPLFISLPFRRRMRCRCNCGQTFRSYEAYRGHYALRHILEL